MMTEQEEVRKLFWDKTIYASLVSSQLTCTTLVLARGTQETGVLRMASSPSET